MIIKTKVKSNKRDNNKTIIAWIQKHKDFDPDIQGILNFFKDQITYTLITRINVYYKITSDNPAIMLSLISSIQDLIAENYFSIEESLEVQESTNFQL
ncbi:MAG: hypothetical protein ACFE9S_17235 [Candidatus Hermodarchaeota archaeon]